MLKLKSKTLRVLFLLFILFFNTNTKSIAQQNKINLDSLKNARKHIVDSTKAYRLHFVDSIKTVRFHFTDSLTKTRKYKDSRHYKDSVEKAKLNRTKSLQTKIKERADSLKQIRQNHIDSLKNSRLIVLDSLKKIRDQRVEILTSQRKYKDSKRFKDSVAVVTKSKKILLEAQRKAKTDSLFQIRKSMSDSIKLVRTHTLDSLKQVRTARVDSLTAKRKLIANKLVEKNKSKTSTEKSKQKKNEDLINLKLELKIKKKQSAWNNEKMLKKKWTIPRKIVQNSFTRYNYFYNANRKMKEAYLNMQHASNDNFDSLISLYSFNPDKDSSLLASDMDSVVQKASLGIQVHDPRGKWEDNLYLLLAEAYFYRGNYTESINAFKYVVSLKDKFKTDKQKAKDKLAAKKEKTEPSVVENEDKAWYEFMKHRSSHNEALVWLIKVFTQSKQFGNAESVLDLLINDSNFPQYLKGQLAFENAFLKLQQSDFKNAAILLKEAGSDKNIKTWDRRRAQFLAGQLFQNENNFTDAISCFKNTIALHPKIEMDYEARKNVAHCLLSNGGNLDEAVAMFKGMLNDGKYNLYHEQIYCFLGNLFSAQNQFEGAEKYYKYGLSLTKTTKKQKAKTFACLGNLYYNRAQYILAKNAYDSAIFNGAANPSTDSAINLAKRRNALLNQIVTPIKTIAKNDSILVLAEMNEKEQKTVIRKYIKYLENKRADSIFNSETKSNVAQSEDLNNGQNNSNAWYFSNNNLMQQGYNEFKQKWGNRKLGDNWRRINAVGISSNEAPNTIVNSDDTTNNNLENNNTNSFLKLDQNGIPTEDYLLALIPKSPSRKKLLEKGIQRAYLDLATTYYKQFDEYQKAKNTLDSLDQKYATHSYEAEEYYIKYQIAIHSNQFSEAKVIAASLKEKYPKTFWYGLINPIETTDDSSTKTNLNATEQYDMTYQLLLDKKFNELLKKLTTSQRKNNNYQKKYQIIEATALAMTGKIWEADTIIDRFISLYPTDSLKPWAEQLKIYIDSNKKNNPKPNVSLLKIDTLAKKVINIDQPKSIKQPDSVVQLTAFKYLPKTKHYFVLATNNDNRSIAFKSGINEFSRIKYDTLNLKTTIDTLDNNKIIIATKTFTNADLAKKFKNDLRQNPVLLKDYNAKDFELFIISETNYLRLRSLKNWNEYLVFYKKNYGK